MSATPKTPNIDVKAERRGPVTILTLSYTERRNALAIPLRARLLTELQAALDDENCRTIVLTGEGAHFCSGGDITSFEGVTPAKGRLRMQYVHRIMRLLIRGEKPVIAAVEGHAAGAGMCLAAACDIALASTDANACLSEVKLGLIPAMISPYVVKAMGESTARRYFLTAEVIEAAEAYRIGLAQWLVPHEQVMAKAMEVATQIAELPPLATRMVKESLVRGMDVPNLADAALTDVYRFMALEQTDDAREAHRAWREGRPPSVRGS